MTALTQRLQLRFPIIQAPMAGVQGWELAAAVSDTGALGSLPCAMLSPEAIRKAVAQIRARTSGPINLNFFAHQQPTPDPAAQEAWLAKFRPFYQELDVPLPEGPGGASRQPFNETLADLVGELKPEVVSFHFGLPAPALMTKVRDSGALVLSTATTIAEARWLADHGADAIIAQGWEAGGHRGLFLDQDTSNQLGTFALLPQVVAAVDVPVIAAGGIADAQGVRAAMALGASGVQVGTAYLLCPEATTSEVHRAALQSDAGLTTTVTNVFSGRPARGIVNRMIRTLGPMNDQAPSFPLATAASAPLRAKAESLGSGDFSPLWAGQNISGCQPLPARALTLGLAEGLA
ncbi:NAD(P)H-dependent flavin oxidoreductase [Marinobacter xestospongiae]|uniref:Propionate 3-nitronate monooxygenase n=1 Tax=Marinobacter xestospongiae TaxID=994319 RepID=A0ABU3W460_9GAMM|nr:nitronate monooxygenase [Marinobacter xestospongiae]MDV2080796.1 nitronate monooxygenase [Marinobacter xestospongiae]